MAMVRMGRTKRNSVGGGSDVKKCETCLPREERLMQIRRAVEKFRCAGDGGRTIRSHSG